MAVLFDPHYQAVDANGLPLSGGTLAFYQAGTTTPITIYQNEAGTTPHTNPVVADSAGLFAPIYVVATTAFKTLLKTAAGVTVQTVDNIDYGVSVEDLGSDVTDILAPIVPDVAGVAAVDPTIFPAAINVSALQGGVYVWETGDHAAEVAADTDGAMVVEADTVAATTGAYVRRLYGPPQFNWWNPPQGNTGNCGPHLARAMASEPEIWIDQIQSGFRFTDPIVFTTSGQRLKGYGRQKSLIRFAQTSGECIYNTNYTGTSGSDTHLDDCGIYDMYLEAASMTTGTILAPRDTRNFSLINSWLYGSDKVATTLLNCVNVWPNGSNYIKVHGNYFSRGGVQWRMGDGCNAASVGWNRFQPYAIDGFSQAIVAQGTAAGRITAFNGLGGNVIEMPGNVSDGMYLDLGVNDWTLGGWYIEALRTGINLTANAVNVAKGGRLHISDCTTAITNNSTSFSSEIQAQAVITGATGATTRNDGFSSISRASTGIYNLAFTTARPTATYIPSVTAIGAGIAIVASVTASNFQIQFKDLAGAAADPTTLFVTVSHWA